MKLLTRLFVPLLFAALPAGAEMVFDSTLVEIEVKPGENVVKVAFPFVVKGEAETIVKADVFCTCLKQVRVEPLNPDRSSKMNWKVGEKGILTARFETKKFLRTVEKEMGLVLKDRKEPINLTVRVKIPELIVIEPNSLNWKKGEPGEEKVIKISMKHKDPIKIISHKGTNDGAFPYSLKTIKEGWEYELTVKPANTNEFGMSTIYLRTDSNLPRFKRKAVYAMVPTKQATPPAAGK